MGSMAKCQLRSKSGKCKRESFAAGKDGAMKTRIKFYSTVEDVAERFRSEYVSGKYPDAIFRSVSMGWFLHLEGSYEALGLGPDKPDFQVGDKVEIIIQKTDDRRTHS